MRVQKMGQEEVTSIEGVVVLLKEVKEACENKPSLRLDAGRQILTSLGLGERLSRKYAMIAGLGSEEVECRSATRIPLWFIRVRISFCVSEDRQKCPNFRLACVSCLVISGGLTVYTCLSG